MRTNKMFRMLVVCLLFCTTSYSQTIVYPYSVSYLNFTIENKPVRMAYMDVRGDNPSAETVLLFHGKNFNAYYWKGVIAGLIRSGYRVVVPDQIGWGLSDKPDIHYSFHLLAHNTKRLLDTLGIQKVHIIGHSMGGMLATRFALMFPATVSHLILENPIGLEDYKTFVPYRTPDSLYQSELKASFASLKKYQQTYYPQWKPEYEEYVTAQLAALQVPDFETGARASALTYQMIYEQPVVYEFKNITAPCLIVIGQEDRTIVGKNLLTPEVIAQHGKYPELGRWLNKEISNSKLVELAGVGHIPHIQEPKLFLQHVKDFLSAKP